MKYCVNIIYYRSHKWYERNKIIKRLNNSVFVYEDYIVLYCIIVSWNPGLCTKIILYYIV